MSLPERDSSHGATALGRNEGDNKPRNRPDLLNLILLVVALLALIAAFIVVAIRDNGDTWYFPWLLVFLAFIALVASAFFLMKSTADGDRKPMIAAAACIGLSIVAILWASFSPGRVTENEPGQGDESSAEATAPAPDPDKPAYDEVTRPGAGYDGASELVQLRSAAAELELPVGDMDFRAPYSDHELELLQNRQLEWLRSHSDHQPAVTLARILGIPNPSGKTLADYLENQADLEEIGEDGLRVNNFMYDADAQLAFAKEEVLPAGDLVWSHEDGDDEPFARWVCLNHIVPVG